MTEREGGSILHTSKQNPTRYTACADQFDDREQKRLHPAFEEETFGGRRTLDICHLLGPALSLNTREEEGIPCSDTGKLVENADLAIQDLFSKLFDRE